jgi:peptide/nickel transport system permease protein
MVRGQVMAHKHREYVQAARAIGLSVFEILFTEIMPNIIGPVLAVSSATFAAAILTEAGLSFLGIGIQPPQPSWGYMIKEHYNFLLTDRPLMAIIPGFAIMLTVLSFNEIAQYIRDRYDVKEPK